MEENKDKAPYQNRMKQDVENTSRTMQPGKTQNSKSNASKGQEFGWHGGPEGHAKADSQSSEESGDKKP